MKNAPRYMLCSYACPPEGWTDPFWSTEMTPPAVGRMYGLKCVDVSTQDDGLVCATFALCPIP